MSKPIKWSIKIKPKLQCLVLLCSISYHVNAQQFLNIGLNIGDTVPPLKIKHWIKGPSVKSFEKDKIYVLEFWATWCVPCLASMPRLSKLALKYQNKVNVLAIDVYEKEDTPIADIIKVVDAQGNRMNFPVGIEAGKFMSKNWLDTSEARGIPTTFIVNNGKLDWIGHPQYLDSVLTKILNKTWRPDLARLKRNNQLYLGDLEFMASKELVDRLYYYKVNKAQNTHDRVIISPDSVLFQIDDMVKNVPTLKFLPVFVAFTVSALLQTNQQKAYDYIKEAMVTPTYEDSPPYDTLIGQIEENSDSIQISENIYKLGAVCCQALIDKDSYPEFGNISKNYKKMANFYRLAGDLSKAAEAEQKGKEFIDSIAKE